MNWFMKFSSTHDHVWADIIAALIREFKKPKSESQCITELKEIQQRRGESVWDFDQRFKVLLDQPRIRNKSFLGYRWHALNLRCKWIPTN